MLQTDYIVEQLSKILPIYYDTYDVVEAKQRLMDELTIYVNGAINKASNEGVPNVFKEGTTEAYDYILCLSYQIALDMGIETDYELVTSKYITRINTLRSAISTSSNP